MTNFFSWLFAQDSSDGPKNESLADHLKHCEAKPGNCPFEKAISEESVKEDGLRPSGKKNNENKHQSKAVSESEHSAFSDAVNRVNEYANERTNELAPNGKRSNLSNALYHLVRTKRFKDWFGDWEVTSLFNLATKAWGDKSFIGKFVFPPSQKLGDKLRDLLGHDINEIVITADSVRHMKNHHGDEAYESARGQVAMTPEDVAVLPYVLNNFDDAVREPSYDLRDGNKAVTIYKRINGVSIATTISKGRDKQFVVSGWKLVSTGSMPQNVTPNLNALSDVDVSIVQKEIAEIKGAAKNCSKVVDENGEPMVVWHGGRNGNDFTVFDESKVKNGFYFSPPSRRDSVAGYYGHGKERPFFLGLRNPLEHVSNDGAEVGSHDGIIVRSDVNSTHKFYNYRTDAVEEEKVAAGDIVEIVALSPSQIKSADAVTKDDDGNVIPLAKRFSGQCNDIRW